MVDALLRSRCCSYLVLREFAAFEAFFTELRVLCLPVYSEPFSTTMPVSHREPLQGLSRSDLSTYDSYAPPQPFGAEASSMVQPTSTSLLLRRTIACESFR